MDFDPFISTPGMKTGSFMVVFSDMLLMTKNLPGVGQAVNINNPVC